MKYSVKIILKYVVESGETFIEESIILLDAGSFDEAYEKAEQYVKEYGVNEPYTNMYGKQVRTEVSYSDCYCVYEDDDVIEVYSSIKKGREKLSEEMIVSALDDCCTKEELLPLRRWPEPK